jgi:hypothetical protein
MDYKRVSGGQKNDKTGVKWTKSELIEVYNLYKDLGGQGLHEHNPKIQKLAIKLERTVRSVEAQTLMYRNLERGGDYSHGNMNNLCREIWNEMEKMNKVTFPNDLLNWAGHKRGGVKKPFDQSTGRPNGFVIKTELTSKIDEWISDFNETSPRIILLIGGPGNGKTDSLEYLVSKLDDKLNTRYFDEISLKMKGSSIVPRKVSISANEILNICQLTIVQDASVGENNLTSEICLINDIDTALDNNDIYIACINRGILAESLSKAKTLNSKVYAILNQITKAISQQIDQLPLWPLSEVDQKLKAVAIWPMDMESLVQVREKEESIPAFQIIKEAVNQEKWNCQSCAIDKENCPFYQNMITFQDKSNVLGLLNLLHDFEIIANKRWSFRELFSLISYLFVGSEQTFGNSSPCEWSVSKIDGLRSSSVKDFNRSLHDLNGELYHTKLFSLWPNFNSVARTSNSEINEILQKSEETKEWFNYFSYVKSKVKTKSEIASLLDSQFFDLMDPSQLSNEDLFLEGLGISLRDLESRFSYSVNTGFNEIKNELNSLEKMYFDRLETIERHLDSDVRYLGNISSSKIDYLLRVLRSIGVRYFKRIYFTRLGISKDKRFLEAYRKLNPIEDLNKDEIRKAARLFEDLIQDKNNLVLLLNTSFAQPIPAPEERIIIKLKRVRVRPNYITKEFEDVPRAEIKTFKVDFKEEFEMVITYQLFKALMMIQNGVRQASLPKEVLAMLDKIKSKISGIIVRDPELLFDAKLIIGNSNHEYRIVDAQYDVEIMKE